MRVRDFYLHFYVFFLVGMYLSFTFLDFIVRVYRTSFNMSRLLTRAQLGGGGVNTSVP